MSLRQRLCAPRANMRALLLPSLRACAVWIACCSFVVVGTRAQAQVPPTSPRADAMQEMRRELQELRKRVDELEKQVAGEHKASTEASSPTASHATGAPVTNPTGADPQHGPGDPSIPVIPPAFTVSSLDSLLDDNNREAYGFGVGRSRLGFRVTYVYKGSQAETAGLLPRDRILTINGVDISGWTPSQMATYLADNKTLKMTRAPRGGEPPATATVRELELVQEKQGNFIPLSGKFAFVNGDHGSLTEVQVGQQVPDFDVMAFPYSPDKAKRSLKSLQSTWLLVVFAEGWGEPYFTEWASIRNTAEALAGNGQLKLVAVCMATDDAKFDRLFEKDAKGWYACYDGKTWDNDAAMAWGVYVTPTISLVAPGGILRRSHIPQDRLLETVREEMNAALTPLKATPALP